MRALGVPDCPRDIPSFAGRLPRRSGTPASKTYSRKMKSNFGRLPKGCNPT